MTKMIAGDRVDVDAAGGAALRLLADIRPVVVEQKAATNGGGLTARPELLAVDSGEEVESDDEDELAGAKKATPKYEAPKLVPMHFDENEEERKMKRVEKARKRAMQSSLIQDLHAQYSEAPQGTLDSLLKFGDYMAMDTVLEDGGGKKAKKRKAKFTKKGAPSKKKSKGASKRRR
ncbi:hypothetical protein M3Y99_01096600 [Aphelenchoides fujianensis]|nr:hypothetical protein M3Y99_01096600 [Aphelenchoides fujianensis]